MSKNYLLLIDYNLTRVDDVKTLVNYAKEKYQLDTILIRPNPTMDDLAITDIVIDLDPRSDSFMGAAKKALLPYAGKLYAGVAFSDNAVFAGAKLLESLGLAVDSPVLAEAAFSKICYRTFEQQYQTLIKAQGVFIPKFSIIKSMEDLFSFAKQCSDFVLKPACEGNNRGVIVLNSQDDMQEAWENVKKYVADGILCEELIPFNDEYSYDGIGHLHFITKKISAKGKYPVELGQIVYGNFGDASGLIRKAGHIANLLTGQCNGPFHNEIRLSADKQNAAVIEPNRRPAGMRIWSLAEKVYGHNFYHLWLDKIIANKLPANLLSNQKVAAIRMLGSPVDGLLNLPLKIKDNPYTLINDALTLFKDQNNKLNIKWLEFKLTKNNGDYTPSVPRDNSDFIAQISILIDDDKIDMSQTLEQLHHCWLAVIRKYITIKSGAFA